MQIFLLVTSLTTVMKQKKPQKVSSDVDELLTPCETQLICKPTRDQRRGYCGWTRYPYRYVAITMASAAWSFVVTDVALQCD